jgi:ATP-dependent Lon protease
MHADAAVLPLRGPVVFPGMLHTVPVGRESSIGAVDAHLDRNLPLVLVPQVDPDEEDPLVARLAATGTAVRVLRVTQLPDGSARVLVEGVGRVRVKGPIRVVDGGTRVDVGPFPEAKDDPVAVSALGKSVRDLYAEWLSHGGFAPQDQELLADVAEDPERLADRVAANLPLGLVDRIEILDEPSLKVRLDRLLHHLVRTVAGQRVAAEVNERVQKAMDQSQREYHLKEQMKVLRDELATLQGTPGDADSFEKKVKDAGMPAEAEAEALREVERLRRLQPDSAEYTISRTWLETACDVPWSVHTEDVKDPKAAKKVLEDDHYGLDKVKERILEYLAVRQLNPESKGPILCFVGPPGVGKTSLGRSIAKALGRHFGRIALGGVKDETEIRGHRRTYVGALPGRIIRALIRAGSNNPVLVLDEIDKVGNDFRGDPASALLEVLDPEQNVAFVDHYLDVAVDLSQVLFIATANVMDTIPAALSDRLEIIEIPGYTEEEKVAIAKGHLLPRLAERHGLGKEPPKFTSKALLRAIRDYTREAGLRDLERQLAAIHRKLARKIVEGASKKQKVDDAALPDFLGPPKFFLELAERVDQPGVVIGLAWTSSGGDILFVEATKMPGNLSLKLTGSLGPVMKESAEAAMSWLRSHAGDYGLDKETFAHEFHLHVPAGAIPKDGPSAGVTMVTAIASVVTGRPAKARLAMTGEITLRGKVLPVGGVKEKVLAARRAGVKTVILPRHNANDLEDVPKELRDDLTFHFVDTVAEVLELALEPKG